MKAIPFGWWIIQLWPCKGNLFKIVYGHLTCISSARTRFPFIILLQPRLLDPQYHIILTIQDQSPHGFTYPNWRYHVVWTFSGIHLILKWVIQSVAVTPLSLNVVKYIIIWTISQTFNQECHRLPIKYRMLFIPF